VDVVVRYRRCEEEENSAPRLLNRSMVRAPAFTCFGELDILEVLTICSPAFGLNSAMKGDVCRRGRRLLISRQGRSISSPMEAASEHNQPLQSDRVYVKCMRELSIIMRARVTIFREIGESEDICDTVKS
jgi:hypothetical protein